MEFVRDVRSNAALSVVPRSKLCDGMCMQWSGHCSSQRKWRGFDAEGSSANFGLLVHSARIRIISPRFCGGSGALTKLGKDSVVRFSLGEGLIMFVVLYAEDRV